MGDGVPFVSTTSFGSHSFGGTAMFTLVADTTVYAGVYASAPFNGSNHMPIGFASSGSSYQRYSGANPPVVGNAISGGIAATLGRTYDFSVTVIPEPASGLMLVASMAGLGLLRRKLRG
jgi:hypothetical protein